MPRRNSRDPKTNPKARLGELLAQAREAAGFATQAAFAEHLAVDRTVVGKAESGERPPSARIDHAYALSAMKFADGRVSLDNGVHRWAVAVELGIKRVPVAMGHESAEPTWAWG